MNREVICFDAVAPARERGLKIGSAAGAVAGGMSLPRGSVD